MKINELNLDGYKHIMKNNWEIPEKLAEWLEFNHFEMIGSGTFSSVWLSDDCDFVIKLGNMNKIDKNLLKFVDFCHKTNDPHFPKFGKFKNIGDNSFVIFMEKLYHANFNNSLSWFLRLYSEFLMNHSSLDYKKSLQKFFKKENVNINDLIYDIEDWLDVEKNINIKGRQISGVEQINSLTKSVYDATLAMKHVLDDIGNGNIMQRKDGTLVLNDPIFG